MNKDLQKGNKTGSLLAVSRYRAMLVCCCVYLLMALSTQGVAGEDGIQDMLKLYQDTQLLEAQKLALKYPDKPEARLVLHLCQVYDQKNRDYKNGLAGLHKLYEDVNLKQKNPRIWAEASLNYARIINIFQNRSIYPEYNDVDISEIYRSIIDNADDLPQAYVAVTYLAEHLFSRNSPPLSERAFKTVEKFLSTHKGKLSVPVHLFIERYYILLDNNYAKSAEHLKAAYNAGIAKGSFRREILFRMGRINQLKLKNKKEAEKYYGKFLEIYPDGKRASLAKRYLKEMKEQTGGKNSRNGRESDNG